LPLAISTATEYGVNEEDIKNIVTEVAQAVKDWQKEAKLMGISSSEIQKMSSALEHIDLERALNKTI